MSLIGTRWQRNTPDGRVVVAVVEGFTEGGTHARARAWIVGSNTRWGELILVDRLDREGAEWKPADLCSVAGLA